MSILTVTELTQSIKKTLEPCFSQIQVKGEVTNLRHQTSGHFYFTLKDKDAQISAVLFKGNAQRISKLPEDGNQIILYGKLSLYAPRGNYQIIVHKIEYAGVGELLLKFHQLKEKLHKQGWTHPEMKKPLPKFPKTIGVVTSPTGSIIQDIIHVLKRRFAKFHLILNPIRVQGIEASKEIVAAIEEFNTYKLADVLIVGRGGGSLEDLWPFNEWCVAEAIFYSKIPIISAVGHETDVTIADFVADVRAPTPSAAAEMSVRQFSSQIDFFNQVMTRMDQILKQSIRHSKNLLNTIQKHPLIDSPYTLLADHLQKIDNLSCDIDQCIHNYVEKKEVRLIGFQKQFQTLKPSTQVQYLKTQLQGFSRSIHESIDHLILIWKEKLTHIHDHLKAVNPKNILQKGYCIPFSEKDNSVIIGAQNLKKGMELSLQFHNGRVQTIVKESTPKKNEYT